MTDNNFRPNGEGEAMQIQKPTLRYDLNLGTVTTIILACIAGLYYISRLEGKQNEQALSVNGLERSMLQMETRFEALADNPIRIKALEEAQKSTNARLDRLADTILSGQENMRRDFNAAVEILRKDINTVGTKVEVIGSKMNDPRPMPGSFRVK
jgi:hypothetical protein